MAFSTAAPSAKRDEGEPQKDSRNVLQMEFENSSPSARIEGETELFRSNYFVDQDSRVDVPNYATVRYHSIYPGVDLLYHGDKGIFEYDLILAPMADPSEISFRITGADIITASAEGDLILRTKIGDIIFRRPVAYQDIGGERISVRANYALEGQRVSFNLDAYDSSQPLVIDPILSYSTLFGWGTATKVAADSNGNAYVVGYTTTNTLPASTGYKTSLTGAQDAWVAKIDPAGTRVIWASFLGARNATSSATSVAVDSSGNVYVSGLTSSSSFPHTAGAYQGTFTGGSTAYVTKLNSSGNALVYSTFVPFDAAAIALDSSGQVHVYGNALAPFTPTANAFQRNAMVLAVMKLNATGSGIVYATYLGNGGMRGIAVDGSGNAYTAGISGLGFPVVNAFQPIPKGGNEPFIAKLNPAGSALVYSTFLGGSADDNARDIAVDSAGNVVVVGETFSDDFPTTPGSFQPSKGWPGPMVSNGFVAKLSSAGGLIFGTYLGGSFCHKKGCNYICTNGEPGCPPRIDLALAVGVDRAGFVSVGGYATSRDFPIVDPIQSIGPTNDDDSLLQPFLAKLSPNGDRMMYSSAFGTRSQYQSNASVVRSMALDSAGSAYVIGNYSGGTTQFPVSPGAPFTSNYLQFLLKVSTGKYPTLINSSPNPAVTSQTITIVASVQSAQTGGTVSFMAGGNVIGTRPLTNGGAVLATTLPAGAHKVTAVYSLDGIASPPIYQVVTSP